MHWRRGNRSRSCFLLLLTGKAALQGGTPSLLYVGLKTVSPLEITIAISTSEGRGRLMVLSSVSFEA